MQSLYPFLKFNFFNLLVYIGIAQVTWHQPCTFENSSFHFHYALQEAFEEISVKNK